MAAYSSIVSIISWRLLRDGASAQLSSEYPQIPLYSPLIQHPDSLCSSIVNRPATYRQYAIAASTRPWPVPFLMGKFGDLSIESHRHLCFKQAQPKMCHFPKDDDGVEHIFF